ncbi:MAG: DUF1266 domain-containing protein [Tannerellaceae bacterium]|nr:DUF1266 domain-containing protein [Tannerellaceae bacterium]
MPKMYIYIAVAIVILFWLLRNQTIRQLFKAFNHKDFTRNPKGSNLTQQQYRALLVGLINGEQLMSYCDLLETGVGRDRLVEGLRDYWGITDRQSAFDLMNSMMEGGHRMYFDMVLDFVKKYPDDGIRTKMINQEYPNNERVAEFAANLAACIKEYKNDPGIPYSEVNLSKGILGWDTGRMVNLARMCCDVGYITSEEAWDLINSAYEAAQENFPDWRSFAISYVIGRGMWGGNSMSYGGIQEIAVKALTQPESPWTKIPLH